MKIVRLAICTLSHELVLYFLEETVMFFGIILNRLFFLIRWIMS